MTIDQWWHHLDPCGSDKASRQPSRMAVQAQQQGTSENLEISCRESSILYMRYLCYIALYQRDVCPTHKVQSKGGPTRPCCIENSAMPTSSYPWGAAGLWRSGLSLSGRLFANMVCCRLSRYIWRTCVGGCWTRQLPPSYKMARTGQ